MKIGLMELAAAAHGRKRLNVVLNTASCWPELPQSTVVALAPVKPSLAR